MRRTRILGVAAALVAAALGLVPPHTAARGASVRDSPGYYPAQDPESTAVLLGRRPGAPLVAMRFVGGARSLEALGRSVCRALHHEAPDSLLTLCVREDEFRGILWPEFPQSRPATGLTWQDAWPILEGRLASGCRGAVNDLGGEPLEFVRFERSDTTARYRNFRLHNGLVLVARTGAGEIRRFDWLRSVAERKGSFKIYSVRD